MPATSGMPKPVDPGAGGCGRVVGIYVAARPGQLPRAVAEAELRAGRGLVGDRYEAGLGTWSAWPGSGRAVTLIAAEVLEQMPAACRIGAAEARRNLVTRGVDLDALVGCDFRIGEVWLRGRRPCEPCAHLERLTRPGVAAALAGRGGLRADVLAGGRIRLGDPLVAGHLAGR
ncbi:MAG: MOSC domain-containing protein [Pseudomonadota bacterium]